MPRYSFVLLDADNTLFDFDGAERKALAALLAQYGYSPDPAVSAAYRRVNSALWAAFARGEVTQDFLLVERFRRFQAAAGGRHDPAQMNADYLAKLAACGELLPGALELCRRLAAAGCTLAIVTNGATAAQRGRFGASPLHTLISYLFISQELGVSKPDPVFFDLVCRKMGITDRRAAVVVGDNPESDILGGNRAGIDTIWYVPRGADDPKGAAPTYTAASYADIERIILSK